MHLDKFVNSPTGRIAMSILLGIGLATFFREVCKGKRCRVIVAPPMDKLDGQTYKVNDKCYTMVKHFSSCDANRKTIRID